MKNKRFLIIILALAVVIVFMILIVIFLFLKKNKSQKKSQLPKKISVSAPSFAQPTKSLKQAQEIYDKKQILNKSLNYIQSQYRPDGYYNYISHELCQVVSGQKKCPFGGQNMFPTTNAWTALAYLGAYDILNDQYYLSLAKRDLEKLMDHCQNQPKECLYVLVQFAKFYQITKDTKYLSFLKNEGTVLLSVSDPDPMLKDIEIRELLILHKLTKNQSYLNEAKKRLKESDDSWLQRSILYYRVSKEGKKVPIPKTVCWNTLAKLQLYEILKQDSYLQEVKETLNNSQLTTLFSLFEHPYQAEPCIETYFQLANLTGNQGFGQTARQLLNQFTENFWDEKNKKLIFGENGIAYITKSLPDVPKNKKMVILSDTGYFIYLLSTALNH